MWKTLTRAFVPLVKNATVLAPESLLHQQLRTTFILKRRHAPFMHKKGSHHKRLRNKHYIYDLVEDTNLKKLPDVKLILTSYVAGVGNAGDQVSVRPNFAYNNLLLPGLAVYASPENIEKYKDYEKKYEDLVYSSATSQRAVNCLSRLFLSVVMNRENPWTLERWHIRATFRKSGYHVPEDAITLPSKPIKGPDMNLENKEFFVTVTVNNMEQVQVRCRIHHWSTDIVERLPHQEYYWKSNVEPIFPEDQAVLQTIPSGPMQKNVV